LFQRSGGGVVWCIGYDKSEGCTNYIYLALQALVAHSKSITSSFLLCKFVDISALSCNQMATCVGTSIYTLDMFAWIVIVKSTLVCGYDVWI